MPAADGVGDGRQPRALWRRARLRVLLPYLAFGVLLIIAPVIFGEEVHHRLAAMETWIGGPGPSRASSVRAEG